MVVGGGRCRGVTFRLVLAWVQTIAVAFGICAFAMEGLIALVRSSQCWLSFVCSFVRRPTPLPSPCARVYAYVCVCVVCVFSVRV